MISFKTKLLQVALKNKYHIAVKSNIKSITYGELLNNSQSIINSISNSTRVGLYFEKSIEYIQCLFALTLSNNKSFLPLELTSPKERLTYVLEDSEIEIIITSNKYNKTLIDKIPKNIEVLYVEDILQCLPLTENITTKKNEPIYVIYTSGSTGKPKGVEISYNGIDNVISQQVEIFNLNKSNFFLYLSISFDASLSDIFCSLLSCSTLFINDSLKKDILNLKTYFNDNKITHSDLPPAILKMIKPFDFIYLDTIIIGGEVADYKSVQEFAKEINVINVYGPTEATICTSYNYCDENWNKPLIGKPLKGIKYAIVDDFNQLTQKGELLISGCQLTTGYLNNKKLNCEKLITISSSESSIYYKTGDLVQYNENGDIEFLGRIDRQIKYHGQLICLEEIEVAINSIKRVKNVSVIFKKEKIYSYYEGGISPDEIKLSLKDKIPTYMIPSYVINKLIPKTITGKNDSSKLLEIDSNSDEISTIANLFRKILKINQNINLNESFVKDLSGDSLDFIQLHISLEQMGINMEYDYLIENNSISDILNYEHSTTKITTDFLVEEFSKMEFPINIREIAKIKPNKILITGATGFLGSNLIGLLLPQVEEIHCIVRGDSMNEGYARLLAILTENKIQMNVSDFAKKIFIHNGDVTLPLFGLEKDIYEFLANNLDNIYHCAAEVNNIKSYKQLYNSNVQSTINVAKFAFHNSSKNLHYASTLSVHVSSDKLKNSIVKEEYLESDGHRLFSGYAQTKWLSEYYLNQINKLSNNIFSYRFGLLTADSNTGISTKGSFLDTCLRELKEINEIPYDNLNISMDITPINIATKAMVSISMNEESNIFNITSDYQLTLTRMAELLNITKVIDAEAWFDKYGSKTVAQHMTLLNNIYIKQRNMNLFETTDVHSFETNNGGKYIDIIDFKIYLKNFKS